MRLCLYLLIILLAAGCRGTKFSYTTDEFVGELGTLRPFKLKEDYDLYVRQVIKVLDSQTRTYIPVNGKVTEEDELIEIEYLLLSKKGNSAIVINNIPNLKRSFYNSEDKRADLSDAADPMKIDIWYFNQFRFGTTDKNTLTFKFTGNAHTWNISRIDNNNIVVKSVGVVDEFGENIQLIEKAFSLEMLFTKQENFLFIFKNNARSKKFADEFFELSMQTLNITQKDNKWFIVFKFDEPLTKNYKNVVFFNDRMYAAPAQ